MTTAREMNHYVNTFALVENARLNTEGGIPTQLSEQTKRRVLAALGVYYDIVTEDGSHDAIALFHQFLDTCRGLGIRDTDTYADISPRNDKQNTLRLSYLPPNADAPHTSMTRKSYRISSLYTL